MSLRNWTAEMQIVCAAVIVSAAAVALSAQAGQTAQAPAAPKQPAQPAAQAQAAPAEAAAKQVVKPPIAQAWLDVATFSGFGMPGMPGMGGPGGGGGMAAAMGAMLGGPKAPGQNDFLRTQTSMAGRWVDVTLSTSRNPSLAEATQTVPQGFGLAPSLRLQTPQKAPPPPPDDTEPDFNYERPKGKISLYWGCGDAVRAGQPKVLDLATAAPQDLAEFFQARRATQRGAHSAVGRPVWPSREDRRMIPEGASLVGEHSFTGQGVPDGFKFAIPAMQDLMPVVALEQEEKNGAHVLRWDVLPQARAYFIQAMGARGGGDEMEMVLWTSSDLPDTGFGLLDYQTNAAVDRWLKDRVLMAPATTTCTVPKGIFGEEGGAMLRMIAYGNELNLTEPPRPADPAIAWERVWAVKIRVKSVANAILGLDMSEMPGEQSSQGESAAESKPQEKKKKKGLKGLLGGIPKS
jgi:hypothetical protein